MERVGEEETSVTLSRLDGRDAVATIRDEWDELAVACGSPLFSRPAWVEVWHRHLQPEAPLVLLAARDAEGSLRGVLPLARVRRPLHARVSVTVGYTAVAGAGIGAADHLGPVTQDPALAMTLFAAANQEAGGTSLYLENLAPEWAPLALGLPGARATRLTGCPAVTRGEGSTFAEAWTKKMAKNVRRRHRQIDEAGISSRWVPPGPGFADALAALRLVHQDRWAAQGGPGNLDAGRMDLLADLAATCREPDVPWILLLEREGEVAAALLGLRSGDSFSVYKTGWSPDHARLSLGIVMGTLAMEWAQEHGLHTFDYLRGDRGHKKDLGCEPVDDVSVLVPRGVSGRLLEQRERLASDGIRPGWYGAVSTAMRQIRDRVPAR